MTETLRTEWSILHAGEVHVFQTEDEAKGFIIKSIQLAAIGVAGVLIEPLTARTITISPFQIVPRVYHERKGSGT